MHTITHSFVRSGLSEFRATIQRTTAPVALLRQKIGEDAWRDVARSVFERLVAELGEGPVSAPFVAHVGLGVK